MIPTARVRKSDGNTGVVRPSNTGVAAVIAPSGAGALNLPTSETRKEIASADFGPGKLAESGAYIMGVAGKPVLLVRGDASVDGAYGSVGTSGAGTSVITAGATDPLDDFDVVVTIVKQGTIGVAGATFKYSLNGGRDTSGERWLGTDSVLTIPDSGVSFALGAGTLLAGEKITCKTTGPRLANADLTASLEALRVTSYPFEEILIRMDADKDTFAACDAWLVARETEGRYFGITLNFRAKNVGETEQQYHDAFQAEFANVAASTGINLSVCAEGADIPLPIRGITQAVPTSLLLVARLMKNALSTDAAFVEDGPLTGASLAATDGSPSHHDEALYPGLDDARAVTLRTFPGPDGPQGVYINNPLLFTASGSDYVYKQHGRVANRASALAVQFFRRKLSKGVLKNEDTGFIDEGEASKLEGGVNAILERELVKPHECVDAKVVLSRTDDLSSNGGAKITGDVEVVSLAYVKDFDLNFKFVKKISVSV